MSKRLGVVLVFAANTEKAVAQAVVDKLCRERVVDAMACDTRVQTFEPEKGSPVWYVP